MITASQRGNIEMISLLLEHKAKINRGNFAGNTPLHIACMANQVEAARFLLRKGANILALNKRLQSPFNAAVEQGSTEVCEFLILAGAPINEVDRAAKTPLMLSALSGFVRIVDMIIKAERFRAAKPEFAAHIAKKFIRELGDQELDEDYEEEYNERLKGSEDLNSSDLVSPPTARNKSPSVSISEAPTYVTGSGSTEIGKFENESDSMDEYANLVGDGNIDDDISISHAETYRSDSDESVGKNMINHLGEQDSVFMTKPQGQKVESEFSIISASESTKESEQWEATEKALNQGEQIRTVSFKNRNVAGPFEPPYPVDSRKMSSLRRLRFQKNETQPARQTPSVESTYSSVFRSKVRFLINTQSYAGRFQTLFFYIAHRKLHRGEWKSLAKYWNFTEEQIEAIELQHIIDRNAYKEHGFRLLCIWLHGLSENTDPAPLLYTALTSIGRRMDANNVQKDFYKATHGHYSYKDDCHIS
ncbi:unnamed protein product [Rodentolepis nana]|uniref:Death domain-containing protein n=1 Tax=Rodentolepis nana TaxID=102285 RepID=A0A3P7V8M2_RODNA|nr:unnamed protein product [Rodentolepis nana]